MKYNKIFCIGFGKTGTCSLGKVLRDFGFKDAKSQRSVELLGSDWGGHKNPSEIIKYCQSGDFFKDNPFGLLDLYKDLDLAFPNSKFILTVRNSPEIWYNSLIRAHTNMFSSDKNRVPNEADLKNSKYIHKGYLLKSKKNYWGYPNVPLYDEKKYKQQYLDSNMKKRKYFKNRSNDFIEINLANTEDLNRLCTFLNIKTNIKEFPWVNKSKRRCS